MDARTYQELAARTVSNPEHLRMCPFTALWVLREAVKVAQLADAEKRAIFYENEVRRETLLSEGRYPKLMNVDLQLRKPNLFKDQELVHGILGLISEVGELAQSLEKYFADEGELDEANVIEELGDLMWYIALILNKLGADLSETMQKNIEKLRVRYPEKFKTTAATERNLEAEKEVFHHTA